MLAVAVGKALVSANIGCSHTDDNSSMLGTSVSDVDSCRLNIEVLVANLASWSLSVLNISDDTRISSLPEMGVGVVVVVVGLGCVKLPASVNSSGSMLIGATPGVTPRGVGVTSLWISDVVWSISGCVN